jgi:hypothetical protein
MLEFTTWCEDAQEATGSHSFRALCADSTKLEAPKSAIAALVPTHYAAEEHIARVLQRLGKPAAAEFIRNKLPTTKQIRSGDLGEILATEYIREETHYEVPINRLRWKDHRNMSMRGEDVIALSLDPATGQLLFLKAEAKSRATLAGAVITEARAALDKDKGLPSAHALSFVSAQLLLLGKTELADAIDDVQLVAGIPGANVAHLIFTFSGNNPDHLLKQSLHAYTGGIAQRYVGLRIQNHVAFVGDVYDLVIANANHD